MSRSFNLGILKEGSDKAKDKIGPTWALSFTEDSTIARDQERRDY